MKKYIWLSAAALLLIGIVGCGITTGQFTIVYSVDDIASTDNDVEMYWLDLNSEPDYADHKDNLKNVESIAIVAFLWNHADEDASGEVWVATDSMYTTADEVRDNGTRIFVSPSIPANDSLMVDWEDSYAHMENVDYLEDLIMDVGAFAIYGLADETPFDVEIQAEIVITLTAGL